MSKKNVLNALAKELPTFAEITLILSQIRNSSDLAAAITGSAIIEAALEECIKGRIKTDRADLIAKIFDNRGPLSSFDSKILLAEAFKIIRPQVAAELNSIRQLRNTFAHAKKILTFDEPVIAQRIMGMGIVRAVKGATDNNNKFELDNRGWFLLAIQLLLVLLIIDNRNVSPMLQKIYADLGEHAKT